MVAVQLPAKLRRNEVLAFFQSLQLSLVGMEACATAHHWTRVLSALGHQVKLMPPAPAVALANKYARFAIHPGER
jgi:transposase